MIKHLFALLAALPFGTAALAATAPLELPPPSIAEWYQPANQRQVWLHTMFGLRRELQAIEEYTAAGDYPAAVKWAKRFAKHYRAVGEMVPEWREELDLESLAAMDAAIRDADGEPLNHALKELKTTCKGCHGRFRATTAALYRTPDYRDHEITLNGETLTYPEAMETLSRLVNRVRIHGADGRPEEALATARALDARLGELAESCGDCHKEKAPQERILGGGGKGLIAALTSGDAKRGGRALGTLAVEVCARCHAIHRPAADLRRHLLRMAE